MTTLTPTPSSTGNSDGSTASGSNVSNSELNYRRDPLYLHPSDTSGLQLVPNQLTQQNYLIWSRSMMIALKSKNKLGFVDGSYKQPADRTSEAYLNWSYVDSAVLRWLLNSMCADLYETYMYTPTARQIWRSLEEKYGTSNRPQIHQIQKQLASLHRVLKKADDIYNSNYVDQFLMGLGEEYENVVSNILLMDPIPSYNKVYAMVARVERQRSVNTSNAIEASALLARANEQQRNAVDRSAGMKYEDRKKEKASRYYSHCGRTGHIIEACFKKHGYPEWFKEYKLQKGSKQSSTDEDRKKMAEIVQEELKKLLKNKSVGEESPVHASYFADFAGNTTTKYSNYFDDTEKKVRWIIDSGAFSHVTGNLNFLVDAKKPRGKNTVQLPDEVNKIVELVGKVHITEGLFLENVLYVPDFKYNLISESKLTLQSGVQVLFNQGGCVMQDQLTKRQLANGRMVKNLYVLDFEEKNKHSGLLACDSEGGDDGDLWHKRLGHPSEDVLSRVVTVGTCSKNKEVKEVQGVKIDDRSKVTDAVDFDLISKDGESQVQEELFPHEEEDMQQVDTTEVGESRRVEESSSVLIPNTSEIPVVSTEGNQETTQSRLSTRERKKPS
ncbi:Cysteine-rich RLK (receptor-like protein kinase) 8 [Senna tora]|uniref:Cysteine-rich RLK (Receptor-like protein kinase) 8 n=1 Tax=Senna tora TaxID=362788 RepID=A0A834WYT3_9FABA|nr:Cysteine-rich RLK (receptor-like protein kinase) 8 [Senna tora]